MRKARKSRILRRLTLGLAVAAFVVPAAQARVDDPGATSGGAVVISELLVNDEKTGPAPAALMSLNMLIETEGRNYTPAEYSAWLEEAGFRHIETVWFDAPAANGAVIGRKP